MRASLVALARVVALALLVALVPAAPVRAQDAPPQGYERVTDRGFVVERMPVDFRRADTAIALLELARAHVQEKLGEAVGEPPPLVILAPTDGEFDRRYTALEGAAPAGDEAAVAWPARRTILVRGPRVDAGVGLLAVLRHELAHLVLGRIEANSERLLPRWLNEGLAEFAAGAELSREDELELAGKANAGTLDDLEELERHFPHHVAGERAYRESLSFVRWLDEHAQGGVRGLVVALAARQGAEEAIWRTTKRTLHEDEALWKSDLAKRHSVWESLARSSPFWWGMVALLVVVAFVRQTIVNRRLKNTME